MHSNSLKLFYKDIKVAPYSIKRALFFSARAILGHAQVPILKNFIFVREFTKIHFSKLNNSALSWSIFFIFGKYIIHIKLQLLTSFQSFSTSEFFLLRKIIFSVILKVPMLKTFWNSFICSIALLWITYKKFKNFDRADT